MGLVWVCVRGWVVGVGVPSVRICEVGEEGGPSEMRQRGRAIDCFEKKKTAVSHLTKLRCTPSPRWTPLHSRQKKIPYETEAQEGIRAEQSTQTCFFFHFFFEKLSFSNFECLFSLSFFPSFSVAWAKERASTLSHEVSAEAQSLRASVRESRHERAGKTSAKPRQLLWFGPRCFAAVQLGAAAESPPRVDGQTPLPSPRARFCPF